MSTAPGKMKSSSRNPDKTRSDLKAIPCDPPCPLWCKLLRTLNSFRQRATDPFPRHIQRLRQNTSLPHHRKKIRIRHPPRQHMHMNMSRDASPRSLADVHPQVNSVGVVELAQHRLHALAKTHHFVSRFGRQLLQLVQMRVRNYHHVPWRVGIRIQNDEAMLAAIYNPCPGIVSTLDRLAEDAPRALSRRGNVGVAPRCPEIIHSGRLADENQSGNSQPAPRCLWRNGRPLGRVLHKAATCL